MKYGEDSVDDEDQSFEGDSSKCCFGNNDDNSWLELYSAKKERCTQKCLIATIVAFVCISVLTVVLVVLLTSNNKACAINSK